MAGNLKKKRSILKIGTRDICGDELFFIVEEGQANQGNIEKALRMIDAAALAGADAIEFQLAKAKDFYVKGDPGYGVYLKREFKNRQLKKLIDYTKAKGLEFIAVPLSHNLVRPLSMFGCSAFNINASDLTNPDIIDSVAASGLPFFLSLSLASENEVDWALRRIKNAKAPHFALLHGQHVMASKDLGVDVEDTNLGFIETLKERYHIPVGFIDHTCLKWFSAAAVAAGAEIVTKHMALSHKDKGPDWQICLDPNEMKDAICRARKTYKSIIVKSKNLANGENMDKTLMRRSIVAARTLRREEVIGRNDLCFKRPGTGICPSKFEDLLGKKLLRNIQKDAQIKLADTKEKES